MRVFHDKISQADSMCVSGPDQGLPGHWRPDSALPLKALVFKAKEVSRRRILGVMTSVWPLVVTTS